MKPILMHSKIQNGAVKSTSGGAIILNGKPMRSGDYEYYGYEVPYKQGIACDSKLIGHISQDDMSEITSQFKGLPVTDDHIDVDFGEYKEKASGTVLSDGTVEGEYVNAEVLISDTKLAYRVVSGAADELSIGFFADIEWAEEKGGPDFYLKNIQLNHLAVVEKGRAGPEARLAHYKATMERKDMPVIYNGAEISADDATKELQKLQNAAQAAKDDLDAMKAARDSALGELSAEKAKAENAKADIPKLAQEMALEHTQFVHECELLGFPDEGISLGNYDISEKKAEILNKAGVEIPDGASPEYIGGAWSAFSRTAGNDMTSNRSVIDTPQTNSAPSGGKKTLAQRAALSQTKKKMESK